MPQYTTDRKLVLEDGQFGLGDWIAVDRDQQKHLLEVADLVHGYVRRDRPKRPLNIYIEASPGAGKSFLVSQICKSVERSLTGKSKSLDLLHFNMTYIHSIRDLTRCFQRIRDVNVERRIPVVFFDEIDAPFANGHVYSYFLAPMFDGRFYEADSDVKIGSAVFFFAASKEIGHIINKSDLKSSHMADKLECSPHDWTGEQVNPQARIPNSGSNGGCAIYYSDWYKARQDERKERITDLRNNRNDGPAKLLDFFDRIDSFVYIPPPWIIPNGDEKDILRQARLIAACMLLSHFPSTYCIRAKALEILALTVAYSKTMREADSIIIRSSLSSNNVFECGHLPGDSDSILREILVKNNKYNLYERLEDPDLKEYYKGMVFLQKNHQRS